jgi:hypothetical protein
MKITIEFEGIDDGNEEIVADKLKEDRYWRVQSVVPTFEKCGCTLRYIDTGGSLTLYGVSPEQWDVIADICEELKDIEDYYKSEKAQQNAIKDLQNAEKQAWAEHDLSLEKPY